MKTYSAGLTARLTGDQVLAEQIRHAVTLTLVNGEVIRMAEVHDALEIGGHVYLHAPGLKVGSLELAINQGPCSLDIEFCTHGEDSPITYEEVQGGMLDRAALSMGLFLHDNPDDGINELFWGDVTEIRRGNFGFVELSAEGPTNRQTDIVNKVYQSTCRHRFTSPECGIDPAAVTYAGTIVSAADRFITVSGTGGQATDFFNVGLLTLTSGRILKNRKREIRQSTLSGGDQLLELYRHFGGIDPDVGDTVTVRRGCTHDFSETHGNKFYANARRYGGEPRLESDSGDVVSTSAGE